MPEKWARTMLWIGVLIRLSFTFFATNNGGDALARAATTAEWLKHPSLALEFAGLHWLPIHFWMMASLSLLVRNVTWGCRLLSLLCGIFSLWAFWRIARDAYDVPAALLSVTLFVFYSLHIGYSTTSSSEVPYLAFILAGLLSFLAYRRDQRLLTLALAGIFLTIGAGIRYEAWIFIILIVSLLLWNAGDTKWLSWNHFRSALVFGFTAGMWPVFWMVHQWRAHGDLLFALRHNRASIPDQLAVNPSHAGLYQVLLPPGVILLTLTPLAVLGGFYALLLAVRESKARELALIACGFMLMHFRSFATGGILAGARYTLTDGMLLALLAGYGLWRLANKLGICGYKRLFFFTTAIAVLNLLAILSFSCTNNEYADKFRSISPLLQYPRRVEGVEKFLFPRLQPTDAALIDNYSEESNILAAAIGLPLLPGDRTFPISRSGPSQVWRYIQVRRPKYVILADAGVLRPYLPLPGTCRGTVELRGLQFSCLFRNEMYCVYSVSYPPFWSSPGSSLSVNQAKAP